MAAAIALGDRGIGQTGNNPAVGCIIAKDGHIVGRGWTQKGGRPHAEAMALGQAGDAATGSDIYVTLEPCAHDSARGPACAHLVAAARPARVIIACQDPDPRTAGRGIAHLEQAGIKVETGVMENDAREGMAGFFTRLRYGRPFVTLKLAISLDGAIALSDGESKWITGDLARAHCHLERARHDAILVGAGTFRADNPQLDVRLPGLEERSPARFILGSERIGAGWTGISSPSGIFRIGHNRLFIEGGAQTAAAFLREDLVDRLLLYRAPILVGGNRAGIADLGLESLADAHGRWRLEESKLLGPKHLVGDRMESYARVRTQEQAD